MVGKIINGSYPKGIFEYAEKEGAYRIDSNMFGSTIKELTHEFLAISEFNGKVELPVKHFMLSFAPEDESKLSDPLVKRITRDYLKEMGITNNQYIAFKHTDTDNSHLHIIVNKVDYDGKNTHISFEQKQSRKVCMALERKYGLFQTKEISPEREKQFKRKYVELEKRLNSKGEFTIKQELKSHIFESLKGKPTFNTFIQRLKNRGVTVSINRAGNGIVFTYKNIKFKGSTLDRKRLSFNAIQERLRDDKVAIPKQRTIILSDKENEQDHKREPKKMDDVHLDSGGVGSDSSADQEKKRRKKRKRKDL